MIQEPYDFCEEKYEDSIAQKKTKLQNKGIQRDIRSKLISTIYVENAEI